MTRAALASLVPALATTGEGVMFAGFLLTSAALGMLERAVRPSRIRYLGRLSSGWE